MKPLERMRLLDEIGRELQSRMTFNDIDAYLRQWRIDLTQDTPPVNSKYVYVKALLAGETDDTLLDIAEELEIDHGVPRTAQHEIVDSRYWSPGHFRLFVSHTSSVKESAGALQKALRNYGISAFVAHEDIRPTAEWEQEILRALYSMDALVAIITPDFKDSAWTDQETGIAIGLQKMVVPIRRAADPHGFVAKYQGLQGRGKSVRDVANDLFLVLIANPRTRGQMARALVDLFLFSSSATEGRRWLALLTEFENVPSRELERLGENAYKSELVASHVSVRKALNDLLGAAGLPQIPEAGAEEPVEIEVPF